MKWPISEESCWGGVRGLGWLVCGLRPLSLLGPLGGYGFSCTRGVCGNVIAICVASFLRQALRWCMQGGLLPYWHTFWQFLQHFGSQRVPLSYVTLIMCTSVATFRSKAALIVTFFGLVTRESIWCTNYQTISIVMCAITRHGFSLQSSTVIISFASPIFQLKDLNGCTTAKVESLLLQVYIKMGYSGRLAMWLPQH